MTRGEWLGWLPAIAGYAALVVVSACLPSAFLGDDLAAYLAAGGDLLRGLPIYAGRITEQGVFLYSPVWALLFAPLSLLPTALVHGGLALLDLLCLRFLAGSWRNAGYLLLLPVVVFSVTSGNIDLLIAAAMVIAWRAAAGPLVLFAAAKIAPGFGLPLHRWREALLVALVMFAVTLPWLGLWGEWVWFLWHQPTEIGWMLPIPWWSRLPLALLLLVPRRPWTSALAAVVATPGFYWTTTVLLLAPVRLYLDRRDPRLVAATEAEWKHLGWLDRLLAPGSRRRLAELVGAHAFLPAHERGVEPRKVAESA
ncbi:MAG TPA: hypothetical protein VFK38_10655 [Candidatus Limnocylindrales bacterium]|nr:hypothetical protein [Candidatus Limnocylindrales bacterium]